MKIGEVFGENLEDGVQADGMAGKAIDVVIEKALRYIGGYIVRKCSLKYPHLGQKASETNSMIKTWIDQKLTEGNY